VQNSGPSERELTDRVKSGDNTLSLEPFGRATPALPCKGTQSTIDNRQNHQASSGFGRRLRGDPGQADASFTGE
jgi:hypothetical protein